LSLIPDPGYFIIKSIVQAVPPHTGIFVEITHLQSYFDALLRHVLLGLGNGVLAKMENAGGKYGICPARYHTISQVLQVTHTA
jgi:hypothetical protein